MLELSVKVVLCEFLLFSVEHGQYVSYYYLPARSWNGCTSAVEGLLRSLPQVCWPATYYRHRARFYVLRRQSWLSYEEPHESSGSDSALMEPDSIDPTSDIPTVVDTHRFYSPDVQGKLYQELMSHQKGHYF